jgi:cytochrome c553
MKNIIVGIFALLILGLMAWTASNGGAYNGGAAGKTIANIPDKKSISAQSMLNEQKKIKSKEDDILNSLRSQAGNIGGFKVSDEYKEKCSACHGIDASGMQYGKKLMGPKLFGQSADALYKKLSDFKSGRVENPIMKGLVMKLDQKDLRRLADEIGQFPARAEALNK